MGDSLAFLSFTSFLCSAVFRQARSKPVHCRRNRQTDLDRQTDTTTERQSWSTHQYLSSSLSCHIIFPAVFRQTREETDRQTDRQTDTELLTDKLGPLISTCYGGNLLPSLWCHIIFAALLLVNLWTDRQTERQRELLTDKLGSLIITCYGGSLLPSLCCHIIFATVFRQTSKETEKQYDWLTNRQTDITTERQSWSTDHYLLWWQPPTFSLLSHQLHCCLETN